MDRSVSHEVIEVRAMLRAIYGVDAVAVMSDDQALKRARELWELRRRGLIGISVRNPGERWPDIPGTPIPMHPEDDGAPRPTP